MKLESLKSSKFEKFEENEIQKSFTVLGGEKKSTINLNPGCDRDDSTDSATNGPEDWTRDDVNMDSDPHTPY